ncbi:signal-regulatory protein beta-2-like [Anguilla rostrata]|uniref:signal-regulatory protein beta-2-like n=1 Tax=Anguilla rostrata TaxID=7938 RepID=UPI0030CB19B9
MPPLCAVLVLFSKVFGLLGNIIQPDTLVRAQIGDTVTLPCFYSENVCDISWYKQPLGQKIQHIAVLVLNEKVPQLFNEFKKKSTRLSAKAANGSFNLTVSQVEPSDSATYHCAMMPYRETIFGDGTTLMVMGSESHNRTVVLQQPESESVQPGDSVTLQCTVHTETCAGEHSVYWFRQGSGESPPGIISTHGTRSNECQRSSGAVSPTQSCVYNVPKRNLSSSDAGTYYCAVATCGEILFGNGTKLDVKGNERLPLYCLAGALTLSVILNIVLALKRRKGCENCKGAASNNQESIEDMASKQSQEESMNYAALTFTTKKPKVRRNKREMEKTVYSDRDLETAVKLSINVSLSKNDRNVPSLELVIIMPCDCK